MNLTGILIDPIARAVSTIQVAPGYKGIGRAIDCKTIELVAHADLEPDHDLWADEEGLFRQTSPHLTLWRDYPNPLVGKLVVLGNRGEDTTSATMTPEQVRARVTFGTLAKVNGRLCILTEHNAVVAIG